MRRSAGFPGAAGLSLLGAVAAVAIGRRPSTDVIPAAAAAEVPARHQFTGPDFRDLAADQGAGGS